MSFPGQAKNETFFHSSSLWTPENGDNDGILHCLCLNCIRLPVINNWFSIFFLAIFWPIIHKRCSYLMLKYFCERWRFGMFKWSQLAVRLIRRFYTFFQREKKTLEISVTLLKCEMRFYQRKKSPECKCRDVCVRALPFHSRSILSHSTISLACDRCRFSQLSIFFFSVYILLQKYTINSTRWALLCCFSCALGHAFHTRMTLNLLNATRNAFHVL